MNKTPPSAPRILAMAAFALSCLGLLLFLWLSFGGSVPLKPKGYRVEVGFPESYEPARELAGYSAVLEVLDPPEVRHELAAIGARLVERYAVAS